MPTRIAGQRAHGLWVGVITAAKRWREQPQVLLDAFGKAARQRSRRFRQRIADDHGDTASSASVEWVQPTSASERPLPNPTALQKRTGRITQARQTGERMALVMAVPPRCLMRRR